MRESWGFIPPDHGIEIQGGFAPEWSKLEIQKLTLGYITKLGSLRPNSSDLQYKIEEATGNFERDCFDHISMQSHIMQVALEDKDLPIVTCHIREAYSMVVAIIFDHLNPSKQKEQETKEPTRKGSLALREKLEKFFKRPQKFELSEDAQNELKRVAHRAIRKATLTSQQWVGEKIDNRLLDELTKGILGTDQRSIENFRENLNRFIQNQPPVSVEDKREESS